MKKIPIAILFILTLFSVSGATVCAYYSDIGTFISPLQVQVVKGPFDDLSQQMQQQKLLDAVNRQTQAIDNAAFYEQQRQNARWRASQDASVRDQLNRQQQSLNNTLERQRQHDLLMPTQASILEDAQRKAAQQMQQQDLLNEMKRQTQAINNATLQAQLRQGAQTHSATVAKTNDQICQEWRKNTIWDGTKNDEGGLVCGCKAGYQWSEEQTACVVVLKKEATPIIPIVKKKTAVVDVDSSDGRGSSSKEETKSAVVNVASDQLLQDTKNSLNKITDHLDATVGRLEKILLRIVERVKIMKDEGIDVVRAEESVANANTKIVAARKELSNLHYIVAHEIYSQDLQKGFSQARESIDIIKGETASSLVGITDTLNTLRTQ